MKIAIIDHYDSFTYNLQGLCKNLYLNAEIYVFSPTNSFDEIELFFPNFFIIGPGPGKPQDYPLSQRIIATYLGKIPIFAVCLGMQLLNEHLGGKTIQLKAPYHGKISEVIHKNTGIFSNMSSPFQVMRYHSLCIEPFKDDAVLAFTKDTKIPMAIGDDLNKYLGVQFHPESFASEYGIEILKNFVDKYVD